MAGNTDDFLLRAHRDKAAARRYFEQAFDRNGTPDFRCARIILSGIETMHMISKGHMKGSGVTRTVADQFHSLVA